MRGVGTGGRAAEQARSRLDDGDAEADVVVAPLRLDPLAEGRAADPAVVGEAGAAAAARVAAVAVGGAPLDGRGSGSVPPGGQAWYQSRHCSTTLPLHVVQAPRVGRVAADFGVAASGDGPLPRLPVVRLHPGNSPACFSFCRRHEVAVVVPARQAYSHCTRWAAKTPTLRAVPRTGVSRVGQLAAESLRLGVVDVVNGEVVPLAPRRRQLSRLGLPHIRRASTRPGVASYLPIEKAPGGQSPSTWSSPGRRSGSLGGLPIRNWPGGHQQSLTPATVQLVAGPGADEGLGTCRAPRNTLGAAK